MKKITFHGSNTTANLTAAIHVPETEDWVKQYYFKRLHHDFLDVYPRFSSVEDKVATRSL
jgi:hypothetical protein